MAGGGRNSGIESIELPNGKYFTFGYDSYGLLNQISYPTGAIVNYTWNTPSSPNGEIQYLESNNNQSCTFGYYAPMVMQRTVKFDGVHPALVQTFTYTTAYNAGVEQAIVQTTVYSSNGSTNLGTYKTVYNYASTEFPVSTPDQQVSFPTSTPVEQTVQYYDYGQTTLLETVTKGWQDQFRLGCQLETYGGSALSGTFYSYGPGLSLTDEKEYDYGQISSTSQCPQTTVGGPITPPGTAPTRETVTTYYQSFANAPATVKTYLNGVSGTLESETDYSYDQSPTSSASATNHDGTNYGPSSTIPRANATTVVRKCLQSAPACSSGNPTTTYSYDETGQITSMKDPCGNGTCSDMTGATHITTYGYTDSYTILSHGSNISYTSPNGNTDAYLTSITNALGQTANFTYDYNNGQLTDSKDQNDINAGRVGTTYIYNDPFARPTQLNYPDGGQIEKAYNDSAPSPTVTTCQLINGTAGATCSATSPATGWKTTLLTMDGLGHPVQTELASDPSGPTYAATVYDGTGREYQTYNPTRCSSITTNCDNETTWGYSTYTHDALGRVTSVNEPDHSVATTKYDQTNANSPGLCTTVTDEAGNSRQSCADALGRMTSVWEAPTATGYNFETVYAYDALNDLLSVIQEGGSSSSNWRIRSFVYDSLSRLTSATNPESGTIAYAYDANSNVASKTAPLENQTGASTVQTTYAYDPLNRLTKKSYNDGGLTPTVQFAYDAGTLSNCLEAPPALTDSNPIGRRTSMCDGSWGTSWSHDPLGRILVPRRLVASASPHELTYTYNLDGSLKTQNDGSGGKTITYTTGGAGLPLSAEDASGNNFVTSAAYAPFGGLTSMINGYTSSFAGITTSNQYNSRLQPAVLSASTPSATVFSQSYVYGGTGGAHNNGNVIHIINNLNNSRNQYFTYDPLNRILTAASAATSGSYCWGQNFTIDPWGNLNHITASQCSAPTLTQTSSTKNQIVGFCYDAAGNLLDEVGCPPSNHTFVYNAEGQLLYTAGYSYLYDGDGQRVAKCTSTGQSSTCPTTSTGTIYFRNLGNESALEEDLSGNFQNEYIFFNGNRVVRSDSSFALHYYFHNHLMTTEVVSNAVGSLPPQQDVDYTPYGIVIDGTPSEHYLFTGKERDTESGLDMFGARHNASSIGRFISPDPGKLKLKHLFDPQGLNRYAYTRNNPLRYVDPDGKDWETAWTDVKAFANSVYTKWTFGIGLGEEAKAGSGKLTAEASYTKTMKITTSDNGGVTFTSTAEVKAASEPGGGGAAAGTAVGVSQVDARYSYGEWTGQESPEPVEVSPSLTAGQADIDVSKEGVGLEDTTCAVLCLGFGGGATREGWSALGDAISNVKNEVILPTPPAPPVPPAPACSGGNDVSCTKE